jgi:hypothetical protein
MTRLGFEPTIPVFERAVTVHALERATTVIGVQYTTLHINSTGSLQHSQDKHDTLKQSITFSLVT